VQAPSSSQGFGIKYDNSAEGINSVPADSTDTESDSPIHTEERDGGFASAGPPGSLTAALADADDELEEQIIGMDADADMDPTLVSPVRTMHPRNKYMFVLELVYCSSDLECRNRFYSIPFDFIHSKNV